MLRCILRWQQLGGHPRPACLPAKPAQVRLPSSCGPLPCGPAVLCVQLISSEIKSAISPEQDPCGCSLVCSSFVHWTRAQSGITSCDRIAARHSMTGNARSSCGQVYCSLPGDVHDAACIVLRDALLMHHMSRAHHYNVRLTYFTSSASFL